MSKKRLLPLGLAGLVAALCTAVGFVSSGTAAPQGHVQGGAGERRRPLQRQGFNQSGSSASAGQQSGSRSRAVESPSAGDYLPNFAPRPGGVNIIIGAGFLLATQERRSRSSSRTRSSRSPTTTSRRSRPGNPREAERQEHRGPDLRHAAEQLPGGLPRRPKGRSSRRRAEHQRRRRRQIPPVDIFLAGYKAGAKRCDPGHHGPDRLLAGLHRPGEVQERRAEPDRRRLAGRVRRGGPLRPRRARGGEGSGPLGRRRRRRPVVPRPAHPHQRGEEGGHRRSTWPIKGAQAGKGSRAAATSPST